MSKFRFQEYTYSSPFGSPRHNWQVVGPLGAINLHVGMHPSGDHGGLEIHYISPPEYMAGSAPSHLDCKLTGGRCWHDGTSLYVEEFLWPLVKPMLRTGDHDQIFQVLQNEYLKRFEGESE